MENSEWLNSSQAANLIGCHAQSIRRWEKEGKIKAYRTPGGQRRFKRSEVEQFTGLATLTVQKRTVCYGRVSTNGQRDDLDRQIDFLGTRYPEAEIISEIGSGLNFRRHKFITILKRVVSGDIQRLVVAHPDRLCRFGFDLIEWLCTEFDCELVVLDNRKLSPQEELINDMLSIVDCFSSRLYGLRKYRKQLALELRTESFQEVAKHSSKLECQDSGISL
ncbi:IS607 family transposase ISTko1 [Dulcicalothrix desertica PCC 7102]|uniref:IS607 family transposase ISTko1 n=1 Tax=Dulcicalothrix desertica PCC 7102 TaxID=232991 RepID=A0A433V8U1_9CYAN|nr:IS607 family transposase [Dulcicalothrix desertica]RUT02526.1 IS607 family transposase ISTko1 [Dulcicalothrix desertica PCC 7102]